MVESHASSSPDAHGAGLVERPLDPLRYDNHSDDPYEARESFVHSCPRTHACSMSDAAQAP